MLAKRLPICTRILDGMVSSGMAEYLEPGEAAIRRPFARGWLSGLPDEMRQGRMHAE